MDDGFDGGGDGGGGEGVGGGGDETEGLHGLSHAAHIVHSIPYLDPTHDICATFSDDTKKICVTKIKMRIFVTIFIFSFNFTIILREFGGRDERESGSEEGIGDAALCAAYANAKVPTFSLASFVEIPTFCNKTETSTPALMRV